MSDSASKPKSALPSWQVQSVPDSPPKDSGADAASPAEPPSTLTVLEQAKKFLEEDEVKNASVEKKVAFLKTKGLTEEEITELGVLLHSTDSPSPKTSETSIHMTAQPQAANPPPSAHDTPPIITYPEFLLQPASPSPLVTKSRLLTTLYAFSALSAALYGTKTYVFTPMLESLTTSRLSLASTASINLQQFIKKLESVVSEIPLSIHNKAEALHDKVEWDDDSDGDPTELFHRDVGIQTSLPSTPTEPVNPLPSFAESVPAPHATRLSHVHASLSEILTASNSEGEAAEEINLNMKVFKDYLYDLANEPISYNYTSSYGNRKNDQKNDEVSKVKDSIRSVKGVLLSTRSFPGVTRRS